MTLSRKGQCFLVLILLLFCIIIYFIFEGIKPYYFTSENTKCHIIDVHVQKWGLKGLFDADYILQVREQYSAARYRGSFFLVDLLFVIIYTSLFLVLSYAFRNRSWCKWMMMLFITGMLMDLSENVIFLNYLYHPSATAAWLTAFCTSIKSLLFPLNIVMSVFLFVRGFFVKEESSIKIV